MLFWVSYARCLIRFTIRVLLLSSESVFLILLVNKVLSFTVNKEIAAIDESSSSCFLSSCRVLCPARETLWVSPRLQLARQLSDGPVSAPEASPAREGAVRRTLAWGQTGGFSSVTDFKHLFISYFSRTISRRGEVLFFKAFGVWVFERWRQVSGAPCWYSLDLPKVLTQELPRLLGIL